MIDKFVYHLLHHFPEDDKCIVGRKHFQHFCYSEMIHIYYEPLSRKMFVFNFLLLFVSDSAAPSRLLPCN